MPAFDDEEYRDIPRHCPERNPSRPARRYTGQALMGPARHIGTTIFVGSKLWTYSKMLHFSNPTSL
jgi:hypothetical protein